MKIKPLRKDLELYLKQHNLMRKFKKQINIFTDNPEHPSLHTEKLEPKSFELHSFRIDRKYRAVFGTRENGEIEIVDINLHYQ